MPARQINLGYIWIADADYPDPANSYDMISPTSPKLADLPYPRNAEYRQLDMTVLNFYTRDLPDLTHTNEGLLDLSINTRNPRDPAQKERIRLSLDFTAQDGEYVPDFRFRRVFRSILFRDYVELQFELIEIDEDLKESYARVKEVLGDIRGISVLDVAMGMPYVAVVSRIMERLVGVFGRNQSDVVWKNSLTLELEPPPGACFLRPGIYVIYESEPGLSVNDAKLHFRGGVLRRHDGTVAPQNHLCFSLGLAASAAH